MDTVDKNFEEFVDFLEGETEAGRCIPSFGELCERLGLSESGLNELLEETYGVGGESIVRSYRTSTPVYIMT